MKLFPLSRPKLAAVLLAAAVLPLTSTVSAQATSREGIKMWGCSGTEVAFNNYFVLDRGSDRWDRYRCIANAGHIRVDLNEFVRWDAGNNAGSFYFDRKRSDGGTDRFHQPFGKFQFDYLQKTDLVLDVTINP